MTCVSSTSNQQFLGCHDGFITSGHDDDVLSLPPLPALFNPGMLPYSKMVDPIATELDPIETSLSIVSSTPLQSSFSFEPTPIGPKSSIHIVADPVKLESLQSMSNLKSLCECLSPLFPSQNKMQQETFDDLLVHSDDISSALMTSADFKIQKSTKPSKAIDQNVTKERSVRLRASHLEQWGQRYQELIEFRRKTGNCLVPLEFPQNPRLSHWVKRQRAQYRLKHDGKHSTLTDDRQEMLEQLGFIWDSHKASWEEKFQDLRMFKQMYGHCNVPTMYPRNPQLASWLKCQRRQLRAYHGEDGSDDEGATSRPSSPSSRNASKSTLCPERVNKLVQIGLPWQKKRRTSKSSAAKRVRQQSQ